MSTATKPDAPATAAPATAAPAPDAAAPDVAATAFPGVTLEHPVTAATIEDGTTVHAVHPDDLFLAARSVKDQGYSLLSLLSAYDAGTHFGVLYAFVAPADNPADFREFRIRCEVAKPEDKEAAKTFTPVIPSLVDLHPAAGWQEREMYDMYGIRFDGHPDLRRMFLPDGWTGFPMRKDYAEPEQFVAMQEGEDIVLKTNEEGSW
jgi:NADH:ubiquinone oxidoreductase subunit C